MPNLFLPCGAADGRVPCALFGFGKNSLSLAAFAVNDWRRADFYVATLRCMQRWTAAERARYFGPRLFLLFGCGADHPFSLTFHDQNRTYDFRAWSAAYPHVRLILSNCRPPLFRYDRDVCLPISAAPPKPQCGPPLHTSMHPPSSSSGSMPLPPPPSRHDLLPPPRYLATFKGTLYSEGQGSVRMLMPLLHNPSKGVVSLVQCRCRGCEGYGGSGNGGGSAAASSKGAAPSKVKLTAIKVNASLVNWKITETDWLLPPRWCAERAREYIAYDYCDLQNTTFALLPDGRSTATRRFNEMLAIGTIPLVLRADKDATTPMPLGRAVPWQSCAYMLLLPSEFQRVWDFLRTQGRTLSKSRQWESRAVACKLLYTTHFATAGRIERTLFDELSSAASNRTGDDKDNHPYWASGQSLLHNEEAIRRTRNARTKKTGGGQTSVPLTVLS